MGILIAVGLILSVTWFGYEGVQTMRRFHRHLRRRFRGHITICVLRRTIMGLQFGLVVPPVVGDATIDHEVLSVTEIGSQSVAFSDTLAGFSGGEVDNPGYLGNDGDIIVGSVTTFGKNGQTAVTPFTLTLKDDLAPTASGVPTVKILARTAPADATAPNAAATPGATPTV